jgi:alpha-1,2-glucosyltransferase
MIKLHPFQNKALLSFNVLALSLFPVVWFYNFLYYTDPGSTFFVLWSYLLSIEKRYWMSALVSD